MSKSKDASPTASINKRLDTLPESPEYYEIVENLCKVYPNMEPISLRFDYYNFHRTLRLSAVPEPRLLAKELARARDVLFGDRLEGVEPPRSGFLSEGAYMRLEEALLDRLLKHDIWKRTAKPDETTWRKSSARQILQALAEAFTLIIRDAEAAAKAAREWETGKQGGIDAITRDFAWAIQGNLRLPCPVKTRVSRNYPDGWKNLDTAEKVLDILKAFRADEKVSSDQIAASLDYERKKRGLPVGAKPTNSEDLTPTTDEQKGDS